MVAYTLLLLGLSSLSIVESRHHIGRGCPWHGDQGNQTSKCIITESTFTALEPQSKSCDNAPQPGECATAAQAVTPFCNSLTTYNISNPYEISAIISLMLFETSGLKYDRNHYPPPGRPGQGTRNIQMPDWNSKYADDLAKAGKLDQAAVATAQKAGDQGKAVLDLLVANPDTDFGSAAWFLATQCSAEVRKGLQSGSEQGWADGYIKNCVGTSPTDERKGGWQNATRLIVGPANWTAAGTTG